MGDSDLLRPAIARAVCERGLSISETARRANVDRAGLSDFLGGKCELRSDVMDRLLTALGLRIATKSARPRRQED